MVWCIPRGSPGYVHALERLAAEKAKKHGELCAAPCIDREETCEDLDSKKAFSSEVRLPKPAGRGPGSKRGLEVVKVGKGSVDTGLGLGSNSSNSSSSVARNPVQPGPPGQGDTRCTNSPGCQLYGVRHYLAILVIHRLHALHQLMDTAPVKPSPHKPMDSQREQID